MWVQSMYGKDPLEEKISTHSSIFAWKFPWTEEPGGHRSSWGHKELDTAEHIHMETFLSQFGGGLLLQVSGV